MNIEHIKAYCKTNGIPFEESWPSSNIVTRSTDWAYLIGLEFKKDIWYWWIDYLKTGIGFELSFSHRYNRNNGVTIRSWRKGYDAEQVIMQN